MGAKARKRIKKSESQKMNDELYNLMMLGMIELLASVTDATRIEVNPKRKPAKKKKGAKRG